MRFWQSRPLEQHVQQIVAQQIDSRVSYHVTPCYSLCHFGYRVKFRYFIRQTHNLSIFWIHFIRHCWKNINVCVMPHINISYSLSIVDLVSMAAAVAAMVFFWLTTQTIRFERSLFRFWQNLYVFRSYRTYNMLIKLIRTGIYPIFYSTKLILNESFIIVNLI